MRGFASSADVRGLIAERGCSECVLPDEPRIRAKHVPRTRRVKRRREERLHEQSLRTLEMDPLTYRGYTPREPISVCLTQDHPAQIQCPQVIPSGTWTDTSDMDMFGKPPCYEDAVMMEDPPPPYSQVLADTRGGIYSKPATGISRKQDPELSKIIPTPEPLVPESTYASFINISGTEQWGTLRRPQTTVDLNRNNLPSEQLAYANLSLLGGNDPTNVELTTSLPDRTCSLPCPFPVIGRTTAV
ncbi:PRR7 protein, partial [Polypterus senegalus]